MSATARTKLTNLNEHSLREHTQNLQQPRKKRIYSVASTPRNLFMSSSGNHTTPEIHENGHFPRGDGGVGYLETTFQHADEQPN